MRVATATGRCFSHKVLWASSQTPPPHAPPSRRCYGRPLLLPYCSGGNAREPPVYMWVCVCVCVYMRFARLSSVIQQRQRPGPGRKAKICLRAARKIHPAFDKNNHPASPAANGKENRHGNRLINANNCPPTKHSLQLAVNQHKIRSFNIFTISCHQ